MADAKAAIEVRRYDPADFDAVDRLWRDAFPDDSAANRAEIAIPAKLACQPDLLFVAARGGKIVGSIMAGYDGHRGWLYSVAVAWEHRRTGIGTMLVRRAEEALVALGCRKINLQVRAANKAVAGFYESLGYAIEDRISLGRRV